MPFTPELVTLFILNITDEKLRFFTSLFKNYKVFNTSIKEDQVLQVTEVDSVFADKTIKYILI